MSRCETHANGNYCFLNTRVTCREGIEINASICNSTCNSGECWISSSYNPQTAAIAITLGVICAFAMVMLLIMVFTPLPPCDNTEEDDSVEGPDPPGERPTPRPQHAEA
jgi:hypothetical protein